MKPTVPKKSIAEEITALIAGGRVETSFFSTYTFSRKFFEHEVLPLVTDEGSVKGLANITVVVDRTRLQDCGSAYEVIRSPKGRLWHAKIIILYVKERNSSRKWTVFGLGSANLTRSGWEKNREYFSFQTWENWRVPQPIREWLVSPFLRKSAFRQWVVKSRIKDKFVTKAGQRLVTSFKTSIWEQLKNPVRWSEARVLAPFTDNKIAGQDDFEDCDGTFFGELANEAASRSSSLHVYLRAAEGRKKTAIGRKPVFVSLALKVNLWIHIVGDENRPLHAKIFAWKCRGVWSCLIGSPNATGAGMVSSSRNIESAIEIPGNSRTLPEELFPKCRGYRVESISFVSPVYDTRPVWDVIDTAEYIKNSGIVRLTWNNKHGPHDTVVLLDRKVVDPHGIRLTGTATRSLETRPRKKHKKETVSGWVPIEMPADMFDSGTVIEDQDLTSEEWLAQLGMPVWGGNNDAPGKGKKTKKGGGRKSKNQDDFPWASMVINLEKRLLAFKEALEKLGISGSGRAADRLERIACQTWNSHDPDDEGLSTHDRAWREWVRAGMWRALKSHRHGLRAYPRWRDIFAKWNRSALRKIREFPIG